jgi:hypothetical protein
MSLITLPIIYPNGCLVIPKSDLDISERERSEMGDLSELWESIKTFGLIHPPLITDNDHYGRDGDANTKRYILIAGGRRTAAMTLGGLDAYPCSYRPGIPRAQFKEIELEENEQRLAMAWQEKVRLIASSHNLRVRLGLEQNVVWTQKKSGAVFGCSHTHVGNCLMLYKFLQQGDEEICKAHTVSDALEILIIRQEELAQKELARRAASEMMLPSENEPTPSSKPSPLAFTPIPQKPNETIAGFLKPIAPKAPAPSVQVSCQDGTAPPTEKKVVNLSKRFVMIDSVRGGLAARGSNWVDHIVTDPPYAVDMANMQDIQDIGIVEEEHDIEENLQALELFIPQAIEAVRSNGFVVFFYDLDHHNHLQQLCRKAGFKVQRWPLTWHKLSNCKNKAPQYNFTKTTEWAMVCRKDNATLIKPQSSCLFSHDGSLEQTMYNNPFAKPFALWKWIYDAVALPGQEVLDPFAGENSSARAAINCGLLPNCMGKKENHYTKGLNDIREFLTKTHGGNISFS